MMEAFFNASGSNGMGQMSGVEMTGWQGLFNSFVLGAVLLCMYFLPIGHDTCGINERPCVGNTLTAFRQLASSPAVTTAFTARGYETQICETLSQRCGQRR
jgi:hypothetical protein